MKVRKNHIHKPRGKNITIFGFKKRILLCHDCGRILNNLTLGRDK